MNDILSLKGHFEQRSNPNRPGPRNLPAGQTVTAAHLINLKNQLIEIAEFWKNNKYFNEVLVSVHYTDVVAKSNRIKDLLSQSTKGANETIVGAKFDKSGEDIKEFCLKFREKHSSVPIIVVPTTYNHVTEEELHDWGVNVVIYANHMLRSAYPAVVNTAKSILTNHRSYEANDMCMSIKDILELIPGTK